MIKKTILFWFFLVFLLFIEKKIQMATKRYIFLVDMVLKRKAQCNIDHRKLKDLSKPKHWTSAGDNGC